MERLKYFIEAGLGLPRDNIIRLLEHHPEWSNVFTYEAKLIEEALLIPGLKLHHGGSTAIPGIVAKPILDIIGEVEYLDELDQKKSLLEKLGYLYKGEYGIKGRRYCTLYNCDETIGYCHLHFFEKDSSELTKHLLFKDYLIQNPEAAKRYEVVKKSLDVPRDQYSAGKTAIIEQLLSEAGYP